jgi:RNA-directed DNA polymerase
MVYRVFSNRLDLMSDAASLATRLTTYQYGLPQGTTTSPFLANLAFQPVDEKLTRFCNNHGITYTRFVDDLTFSAPHEFKSLTEDLCTFITEAGFGIKRSKTCYYSRPVEITGAVVENNRLRAPDRLKRKLSVLDHSSDAFEGLNSYINHVESHGR